MGMTSVGKSSIRCISPRAISPRVVQSTLLVILLALTSIGPLGCLARSAARGDIPAVNAKGWRRGMAAFKIIGVGDDPDGPGSKLPNLIFEFVDPSPFAACLAGSPDCALTGQHDFTVEASLRLVR